MNDVRGCIFDLDGTIIDSDALLLEAWKHGLTILGKNIKEEEIIKYFGMCSEDIAKQLLKNDPELVNELIKHRTRFFNSNWRKMIKPMPGIKEALRYLKSKRFRIAVASSNPKRRIITILKRLCLSEFFNVVVGRDEVKKGKPEPDMVFKAAERLGTKPSNCVYIGDSVYDVIMGKKAGCKTVLLLNRRITPRCKADPDAIIYNLNELKSIF
jgi:HAD superfamily hydrolase (TIGR01509 family)